MDEQMDLFPDTVATPKKRADERIETFIALWKADRRAATLAHLKLAIDDRLKLEPLGLS